MRALLAGIASAACLYGASGGTQSVLDEVSNLRIQYEECRKSQNEEGSEKIKGYRKRIATLESQIKKDNAELKRLIEHTRKVEQELSHKQGVIRSLEKTLTSRDGQYREAVSRNEKLTREANAVKVGKIERENLTKALAKAKGEIARLRIELKKSSPDGSRKELEAANARIADLRTELAAVKSVKTPPAADGGKIQALQNDLNAARAEIIALKHAGAGENVKEKIVEKIVYRDRPVEKTVTKVVEPTEKIAALRAELASARATITTLKNAAAPQQKVVEKVVYKDRTVTKEKVVYVEKPVEKVVYKERPVVQEKIVTKTVYPTEKINALQTKLAAAEARIARLQADAGSSSAKRPLAVASAVPARDVRPAAKEPSAETAKKPLSTPSAQTPKKTGASAYRMAFDGPIYNAPSGSVVDRWEARRSFTAAAPSGGWVHITGYFVNRVWQPTREDEHLWVRESDVIRR